MSNDTTFVRPAHTADRAAIVELIAAMGGHDDIATAAEPLATLDELLVKPECRVLVAEREGRLVGVVSLHARSSLLHDRREAWLGALAVAPDARSTGTGRALLTAADAEAARLGCAAIVLETSATREGAQAFYRREGFHERRLAVRFERSVTSPDGTLEVRFLAAAARAASRVAAAVAGRGRASAVGIGADGAPTEAADAAAERAAFAELLPLGLPIVSEEAGLVGAEHLDPAQPWISLDPLDGSRNFVNGYPAYATSIGLVVAGRPVAGLVADLTGGTRWEARAGGGAWRDGRPVHARRGALVAMPSPIAGGSTLRTLAAFSRVRVSGSTASDLCRVGDGALGAFFALDRPVVHVHDLAAAMCIIEEAGGCVADRSGVTPLLVPEPALTLDIVAACDRETLLALLAAQ